MDGLDLLGADAALAKQYVTLRIKNIDPQTLKYKLSGAAGSFASAGLHFVDASPQAALDIAKPFLVDALKSYGIDAEVTVSNAPLAKGERAISEFWPGLAIGGAIGGSALLIGKLIARIFARR